MHFFTGDNLRGITSGRWLCRPAAPVEADAIGIDTRVGLNGRVFVAIRGEQHDGHDHLAAAKRQGAALAIVERAPDTTLDLPLLLVPDTRRALAQMALAYRRRLVATKVIAVTGSCGKTTTKSLIHDLLATSLSGTAAPRSFNNDIGVPLTLLAARPHDKYLVVEIGTNAPGEIAHLARIVEPDIAVITTIGRAHLAGFGTVEAIAREKASLLSHLRPGGLAVVNSDAPDLEQYARQVGSVIRFGTTEDADLRLTDRGAHPADATGNGPGWWFEVNGRIRFDLALPGRHNAVNALAAVGIGRRMGLDDDRMSAALGAAEAPPMRLSVERIPWSGDRRRAPVTVFNDAYNANPESTIAALETFIEAATTTPRRIIVLGDMLELGEDADAMHREVGLTLVDADLRCRIEHVYLIGPLATHIAESLSRVWPASRYTVRPELDDGVIDVVRRRLRPGDALLVKASRDLGLDRLVTGLRAAPEARIDTGPGPAIEIADGDERTRGAAASRSRPGVRSAQPDGAAT